MHPKNENQMLLHFDVEAQQLPQEVLEEVHQLLIQLFLHATNSQRRETGGNDDREDQSGAPRA